MTDQLVELEGAHHVRSSFFQLKHWPKVCGSRDWMGQRLCNISLIVTWALRMCYMGMPQHWWLGGLCLWVKMGWNRGCSWLMFDVSLRHLFYPIFTRDLPQHSTEHTSCVQKIFWRGSKCCFTTMSFTMACVLKSSSHFLTNICSNKSFERLVRESVVKTSVPYHGQPPAAEDCS